MWVHHVLLITANTPLCSARTKSKTSLLSITTSAEELTDNESLESAFPVDLLRADKVIQKSAEHCFMVSKAFPRGRQPNSSSSPCQNEANCPFAPGVGDIMEDNT